MLDQSIIDKIELENFSEGYDVMQEAEGMNIVDDEIDDLSDAQEDILNGGINESGRIIDLVDLVETSVVPNPASANQPVNNHMQQQSNTVGVAPKPVPSVNRPNNMQQRQSVLPKVNHFGNNVARKFS
jgi:hypothetical protein